MALLGSKELTTTNKQSEVTNMMCVGKRKRNKTRSLMRKEEKGQSRPSV